MALQDDIMEEITFLERRFGFRLSLEAKQLFVSPIIDAYQSRSESSRREFDRIWRNSFKPLDLFKVFPRSITSITPWLSDKGFRFSVIQPGKKYQKQSDARKDQA